MNSSLAHHGNMLAEQLIFLTPCSQKNCCSLLIFAFYLLQIPCFRPRHLDIASEINVQTVMNLYILNDINVYRE